MTADKVKPDSARKLHIVLIWGTFAAEADWVQKGSFFRTTLRRILSECGIDCEFHIFPWSGINSHAARSEASLELVEALLALSERNDGEIHLIGHSHGGSVAYNALSKNPKLKDKVYGLFSLGTPYFLVKARRVPFFRPLISLVAAFYTWGLLNLLKLATGVAITQTISVLISISIGIIMFSMWKWIRAKTRKESEVFGFMTTRDPVPSVCFATFPDEAGLLLLFWSFLSTLTQALWWLLVTLLPLPIIFGLGSVVISEMLVGDSEGIFESAAMVAVGMLAVTALLFLLYALVVGVLRGRFFAYGGESILWNLTHKLRVSTLPNKQSILLRRWYPISFSLRHSRFYSDDNVCREIANRIVNSEFKASKGSWQFGVVFNRIVSLLIYLILLAVFVYFGSFVMIVFVGATAGGF